ncbi:MAG: FAD:protein FMN transferase, partial [Myxococcota bacterium]
MRHGALGVSALCALGLGGCELPAPAAEPALEEAWIGQLAMGTLLEVVVHAPPGRGELVARELVALARELEGELSRHDPGSALSRLNGEAGRGPRPVPPVLARVIADSLAWSHVTGGSFEVSVGPLVALWTHSARRDQPPSPAELAEALESVGSRRVVVSLEAGTVALAVPGMSLDLGGIAKGWALDRMRERLVALGIDRALVSFGRSSILALGAPPGEAGWRVLLDDGVGGHAGLLTLRDAMLSVSGSFGRVSRIAGRSYGHVLDPRTGVPLTEARQAAVLAPTGAGAEALSKALLVLGESEGLKLFESLPRVEGLLLREGGP